MSNSDQFISVHKAWQEICSDLEQYQKQRLSETDTRCKIIDALLIDVLGWEEQLIKREPKVISGFIDYLCGSEPNYFILEAKRTDVDFRFPSGFRHINSSQLKSFPELSSAISQARSYAVEKGTGFFVVSNGLNLAILKTHHHNDDLNDGIIVSGVSSITSHFQYIFGILSPYYNGTKFLEDLLQYNENIRPKPQYGKSLIHEKYINRLKDNNLLAPKLRPYIETFFKDIDSDEELLNELYCDNSKLSGQGQEIKKYLKDRLPFFGMPISEVTTHDTSAGELGNKFKMQIQSKDGHVFLLFGNLGAGKTTFIKRLYNHILDDATRRRIVWLHLDFLKLKPAQTNIHDFISEEIIELLNKQYGHLKVLEWDSLIDIYNDDISLRTKGIWKPYVGTEKLNEKISIYLEEKTQNKLEHLYKILSYIKDSLQYEVLFIFDNVDHHSSELQEEIFNIATADARNLKSIHLVSIRDETFWNMRFRLPFNAHNNISTYQIIPPDVTELLNKRLECAKKNSKIETFDHVRPNNGASVSLKIDMRDVFSSLQNTINFAKTRELFENLSSGNMRHALECFRSMTLSGHTNTHTLFKKVATEDAPRLLTTDNVLKSIALAEYEEYNSERSRIINIYSTFDDGFYSNFVLLRILQCLLEVKDKTFTQDIGKGYIPIDKLFQNLQPYCRDENSLRECLIPLLKGYLIDSDIGSRKHDDKNYADKIGFVKITPTGHFYYSTLCGNFQYLELALNSTKIYSADYYEKLKLATINFRNSKMFSKEGWSLRVNRVELFLNYLEEEENNELIQLKKPPYNSKWGKIVPQVRVIYNLSKDEIARWNKY